MDMRLPDSPAVDQPPGLLRRSTLAALDASFCTPVAPQPLPDPYWVGRSALVERNLGLPQGWMDSAQALQVLAGSATLPGSQPLASVYSGHQFGHWAGQLGDGRALLLGEIVLPGGAARELQLKGAGRTPYSRMGDGRAVLRSSIREFLCSQAMAGLGIPTTLALCVVGSDAPVQRETLETAAVVTRVAESFLRFGHFEHFSHNGAHASLRTLADDTIERFYPHCRAPGESGGNAYAALLQAVGERTAQLLAQWQAVGFCHGVMNTDNMSVLGLTIDYGPFQFLDAFDPGHVCNHSDTQGRYAYHRQPQVAYWNLLCLGQALLPLIGSQDLALQALESYKSVFPQALQQRFAAKLGLPSVVEGDLPLIDELLQLLAAGRVDYTIFWRRLSEWVADAQAEPVRDLFPERAAFDHWQERYERRLQQVDRVQAGARMLQTNPRFVLRNHLGEQAIRAAQRKDFSEVATLLGLLERPFDAHPGFDAYAGFPPDWAAGIEISCSS